MAVFIFDIFYIVLVSKVMYIVYTCIVSELVDSIYSCVCLIILELCFLNF